jgi:riboflavin kinase/FMN adenylyltransferase
VHLLDFQGDIYGEFLTVEFISRLRGEQRFASIDELVAQIQSDVSAARVFFT